MNISRRSSLLPLFAAGVAALLLAGAVELDVQRMLRGQELMSTVYRLILSEHVETIPPDDLLEAAVRGMLSTIDPYAEFIEEGGNAEMDILNRGSYGGLGIKILTWENRHIVSFIYDDVRPLSELRIGDVLLRVDSVDLNDGVNREMRDLLRGTPGTTVRLTIYRPGTADTLDIQAQRHEIEVTPLPYATMLPSGIGYLKIARFSRHAADSLRSTLTEMSRGAPMAGLILDLRDNPGGLLESAVDVVSQFVPQGSPVVSMRGREARTERNYTSSATPMALDLPIVILVNRRSASASEIVAGAIQDLDRGLVLGARTFGKGLVQNILPMNYRTSLKLTTAKYYLPSGRCIQRFHYVGGKAMTSDDTDGTSPVFRTLHLSRDVRESNGIVPDLVFDEDSLATFPRCLRSTYVVFRFVAEYINTRNPSSIPLVDKSVRSDFITWLATSSSCVDSELRNQFTALLLRAEQEELDARTLASLRSLEPRIRIPAETLVKKHWEWIRKELDLEFVMQISGEREHLIRSLAGDALLKSATEMILDNARFQATLKSGPDY